MTTNNQPIADAERVEAFTPGPWRLSSLKFANNDGSIPVLFGDPDSDDSGRIAMIDIQSKAKRGEAWRSKCPTRDANAQLIAAAPDLYEALRDLVEAATTEFNGKGASGYALARLSDARAALRKATGDE